MGRSIGIPELGMNGSRPKSNETKPLAAGDFSPWLIRIKAALKGKADSDVPCGGCTACCRSFQFVHIGPEETDTLSRIPKKFLFPAPLSPKGNMLLGYDKIGRCPMLVDHACSIYGHRPRTCRTYDCRIFPAAGLAADEDKGSIGRQAKRWKFTFPSATDKHQYKAVQAAAGFLREHRDIFPTGVQPKNSIQHAVSAVLVHGAFLRRDRKTGSTSVIQPDVKKVLAELERLSRRKPVE